MAVKNPSVANLAENINQGISNRLKDLHTSMPGIVQSFDAAKQTASVQPAIRRVFVTRQGIEEVLEAKDLPVLINVPVQFPRGGGFSLTFPVKKGDECLLVFTERSLDNWHKFGGVRDPGARRFHSLSDATVFVGISSIPNKVPSYDSVNTQLKKDDGTATVSINADSSIDVNADSNVNITSGADIVGECVNLTANASGAVDVTAGSACTVTAANITLNGNVTVNGNLGVSGTMMNAGKDVGETHSHAQGNDSSGDTQQNINGVI